MPQPLTQKALLPSLNCSKFLVKKFPPFFPHTSQLFAFESALIMGGHTVKPLFHNSGSLTWVACAHPTLVHGSPQVQMDMATERAPSWKRAHGGSEGGRVETDTWVQSETRQSKPGSQRLTMVCLGTPPQQLLCHNFSLSTLLLFCRCYTPL